MLAETGSFSRSAERLFITQSALSRSIRTLEDELGGRLVDRIGKRNLLTPMGEAVVARARSLLLEAEELRRSARQFHEGPGGSIRVGLGSGPGALLMIPWLCQVARHHPQVRTQISRGATEAQLQMIRARQLDALVVDVRRVVPAPDLNIEWLAESRAGFICRSGHPLAGRRSVGIDAVLEFPIASTPLADEVVRLLVERYGPRANPRVMTRLECEDVGSLVETACRTDAVFLGIVAAAREGLQRGELVELQLEPALQGLARFGFVTLKGRTEAPAMRYFRDFVRQTFEEAARLD